MLEAVANSRAKNPRIEVDGRVDRSAIDRNVRLDPHLLQIEVQRPSVPKIIVKTSLQRMRQTILRDPVPQLRQITAPTLLLWGTNDAMIPIANAKDYLQAIPDATRVRLEGMGHTPQEEDPQQSLPPLRTFLTGSVPP